MTKTVLELANELDVTKQAIQYHINKINKKYLSKRHDGAYLISKEAQNIIRESMGIDVDYSDKASTKIADKNLSVDIISILQEELNEKNNQIENLQELLNEQQKLLNQQQQLSLQSNQQIKHLQLELSKESKKIKHEVIGDNRDFKKDEYKKGFWWRIFNL